GDRTLRRGDPCPPPPSTRPTPRGRGGPGGGRPGGDVPAPASARRPAYDAPRAPMLVSETGGSAPSTRLASAAPRGCGVSTIRPSPGPQARGARRRTRGERPISRVVGRSPIAARLLVDRPPRA